MIYLVLAMLTGVVGVILLVRYEDFADDFFGDDDPIDWISGTFLIVATFILASVFAPLLWLAGIGRLIFKHVEKRNA